MANREACELYIEQQIDEALEEGKTPYLIGKEISDMIEKLFEVKINQKTVEKRAERKKNKITTNVVSDSTTENNTEKSGCSGCKIELKDTPELVNKEVKKGKSINQACKIISEKHNLNFDSVESSYKRQKNKKEPIGVKILSNKKEDLKTICTSGGGQFVHIAISQMDRISDSDTDKQKHFYEILKYVLGRIDKEKNDSIEKAFETIRVWLNKNF